MDSSARLAPPALALLLLLGGCAMPSAALGAGAPASATTAATPSPSASPTPSPSASPTASPTATRTTASPPPAATPRTPVTSAPARTRGEAPPVVVADGVAVPFNVGGVAVVSKKHALPRSYVPAWASRPNGLHPSATKAVTRLIAAARADGLTLRVRSGYRSYATQSASFQRALRTYDEATARRYFAEPGKSEHQTGLALDLWDGRNRGTAFARTPQARWIARHAHEFGFIVRYPKGKEDVTGYAWESWHLRYVGTAISSQFGPDSTLTLEEFLGLA